jgi:hypothetical protein
LDKGQEEDRPGRSAGSQVWGPTTGRREQQWDEERHENNEMLCLWRDGSLCRTMSQEEEEVAGCVSSDNKGDRVQ